MLLSNQWPMPAWHDALPESDKGAASVRVLLSIAAVYACESGTLSDLADKLGIKRDALLQTKRRGRITPELAVKIEELLGRERFPRELFRPDIFLIES
jgi:hypothetical protein